MQDLVLKSFESMLKNGDYAEAEALLKKFMELNPEDREAKMLYGTCRLLQGDTATASQVKESRNKPEESLFHVIVSVFIYFLFLPLILFWVFLAIINHFSLWQADYYNYFVSLIVALALSFSYSILTIVRFREKKENAD